MFTNESADQSSLEELQQDEAPAVKRPGSEEILGLISNFLESAGNVLLIQGAPGAGKTTLALELLQRAKATRIGHTEIPPARLYVPSRVSPRKLRKHFPWIHEMHGPLSKESSSDNSTEESAGIRVSEADDVFNKILTIKRSRLRGLMVIDSWEGSPQEHERGRTP